MGHLTRRVLCAQTQMRQALLGHLSREIFDTHVDGDMRDPLRGERSADSGNACFSVTELRCDSLHSRPDFGRGAFLLAIYV